MNKHNAIASAERSITNESVRQCVCGSVCAGVCGRWTHSLKTHSAAEPALATNNFVRPCKIALFPRSNHVKYYPRHLD